MDGGYTITNDGRVVRAQAVPENYTPANAGANTIPRGIHAVRDTEPVGPINQEKHVSDGDSGNEALPERDGRRDRLETGETAGVRRLRRSSAEARRRAEIEAPAVISKQTKVERAARLEELAGDPRAEAYANRRARFWLLLMAALGIGLGVGISSSTAQQTITSYMGWQPGSLAFYAAYGADPALGMVLFATLGARILASARGVVVPQRARIALGRIELVLFCLVAVLNAGPSLGGLVRDVFTGRWGLVGPDAMVLVIHTLGPLLVATGVFGLPFMALVFGEIAAATTAKQQPQGAPQDASSLVNRRSRVPQRFQGDFDKVIAEIDAGRLSTDPTGAEIYRLLGGDAAKKKHLREAVAGYRPYEPEIAA